MQGASAAARLGHAYVGVEHVLLELLEGKPDADAQAALLAVGIGPGDVDRHLEPPGEAGRWISPPLAAPGCSVVQRVWRSDPAGELCARQIS